MAGGFLNNTRRKIVPLAAISKPAGGGQTSIVLPKSGILSKIYVKVSVTIAGSLSAENPLGVSSVIDRVRLSLNTGIDIFNVSGPGFAYLLNEVLESEYHLAMGQNQGRSAVTATSFNLDFYIPVMLNSLDPRGAILLQTDQLQAQLIIDWAADATVATGATVTATATPWLEVFTVPVDPADYPPLNFAHTILEDTRVVSGAGDVTYDILLGAQLLQIMHGLGIGVSGSDGWSRIRTRVNQSDFLHDETPGYQDMEHRLLRGRSRPAGGIFIDLLGTSGLGNYGSFRDIFNTALVTDFANVITATGAGTLRTIRRQLVPLA